VAQSPVSLREGVASMSKWVSGTLMAVNGLGAIAAVNASLLSQAARRASLVFTVGLAIAFIGAVTMHQIGKRMERAGLEMYNFEVNADFSGDHDQQRKTMLEERMKHAARFAWVPLVMAAISALLFVAGVVMFELS
jgi:hypothetical protein